MNWNEVIQAELGKITAYDGSVIPNIKVPNTYRRWRFGCRKLLKLWYRIESGKLHWTPLISTLQGISKYYIDLAALYEKEIIKDPVAEAVYISELSRLSQATFAQSSEIVTDKERIAEKKICSICSTDLVLPAYIVYRDAAGKEINRSKPIGIMCLNSSLSRFKNLLTHKDFTKLLKQVGVILKARGEVAFNPGEDIDIVLQMTNDQLRDLRKEVLDSVMFTNMFHNKEKVDQLKDKLLQVASERIDTQAQVDALLRD